MLPLRGLKVEGSIVNGPELKGDCEMVNVGKKLEKEILEILRDTVYNGKFISIHVNKSQFRKLLKEVKRLIGNFCTTYRDVLVKESRFFSRKGCISLETLVYFFLQLGAKSLKCSLDDFRKMLPRDVSLSGLCQKRDKLSVNGIIELLRAMNQLFAKGCTKTYKGLRILAVDGTDIAIITNPEDKASYFNSSPKAKGKERSKKGFNMCHLTAFYDVLTHSYVDAVFSPRRDSSERRDLADLLGNLKKEIDSSPSQQGIKNLILADRGFECLDLLLMVADMDQYFLFRAKSPACYCSILHNRELPDEMEEFDVDRVIDVCWRKKTPSKLRPDGYGYVGYKEGTVRNPTRVFKFRIVKCKLLSKDSHGKPKYEYLVTNLPRLEFDLEDIHKLYWKRWGIETSFNTLKHTLAGVYFHSEDRERIAKEMWFSLVRANLFKRLADEFYVENARNNGKKYALDFKLFASRCYGLFRKNVTVDKLLEMRCDSYREVKGYRTYPRKLRAQGAKPLQSRPVG